MNPEDVRAARVQEIQSILEHVKPAIDEFFSREHVLLEVNANERSLTHKLAEHLQQQFKDWNVDCEYNRLDDAKKRLPPASPVSTDDTKGRTIYPDIIVHKRRMTENLLVIEMKKSSNDDDLARDKDKLSGLTGPEGKYKYTCGLHLTIDCDRARTAGVMVYVDGSLDNGLSVWFYDLVGSTEGKFESR